MKKTYLEQTVLDAALERLRLIYREFPRVCVSFSGGKDSTVLLHLTIQVAREMGRLPVEALFIDWEAQYETTIRHVEDMMLRPEEVKPYWIALPMATDNGSSALDPLWVAWDRSKKPLWVRTLPEHPCVIHEGNAPEWYRYGITFEEFVPKFQEWLGGGEPFATLVGIRSDESLRRFRAVAKPKKKCAWRGIKWSAEQKGGVVSFFPIYDWKVHDVWGHIGKNALPYNTIYDRMYLAGMPFGDMRICEPYGPEARRNLDKYHPLEPETWFRLVQRVGGANFGAKHGTGIVFAHKRISRPAAFPSWKTYAHFLLDTLPPAVRAHYERRIGVFVQWFRDHRGWEDILDEDDPGKESSKMGGSWRMVCRTILKNDYFCGGLCFGVNKDEYGKLEELRRTHENGGESGEAEDHPDLLG